MLNSVEYAKRENETDYEYGLRLIKSKVEDKPNDLDWEDIVEELNLNIHRDSLRKSVQGEYGGYSVMQHYEEKIRELLNKQSKTSDNKIEDADCNPEKLDETFVKLKKQIFQINGDGSQTDERIILVSDENKLKDVDFLLETHGYNPYEWDLCNSKSSVWNTQRKDEQVITLYASKITVKPKKNVVSFDKIKSMFDEMVSTYNRPIIKKREVCNNGKMLEIPIMDLHLGKLGFKEEVGEDYSSKIAEERFLHVIQDFINRVQGQKFEKIIFPVGQDFFNFSTISGSTIHGTPQDNDKKWQSMILHGQEILVKAIDMLSQIAPVEVFWVAGNHDTTFSFQVVCYLHAWFRNDENVSVSMDYKHRKYVEFGNCLIGYSHGEKEKKRISGIMQVEAKEAWGRTMFHEWHLGHYHSEITKEDNGLILK